MNKKAVFFDIDGTLYDLELGIPESTRRAIRALREAGHIAVVCTGRSRSYVAPEIVALGFDGYIAGAGTYVEYKEEVLWQQIIATEQLRELHQLLGQLEVKYVMEGPECMYYNPDIRDEEYVRRMSEWNDVVRMQPFDYHTCVINKFSCFFSDQEEKQRVLARIGPEYDVIVHDNMPFSEVLPAGISKATGIKHLIEAIGVRQQDTYAFGDSNNDLEMLAYVKYGVAMGNANESVLRSAPYRTRRLEEDGIWHGLKQFGLIRQEEK